MFDMHNRPSADEGLPAAQPDHRIRARLPYVRVVAITHRGQVHYIWARDIGDGGLCCGPLPDDVLVDDPVLVQLTGPSKALLGRIVWRRIMDDEDGAEVGIRFSRPEAGLAEKRRSERE